MGSLIRLEDVIKVYRMGDVEVQALRGVSLEVGEGDFVAIMGASGSGKSTLMNIIGCLDRPTKGRFFFDGDDISGLDRNRLAEIRNTTLGFVFQNFQLLSRTSAEENVELPLLYAGVSTAERRLRAREALARVGLEDRRDHHPSQLSGGQQQRVAIARALVSRPDVVFADEPTGNLDSHASVEVLELLRRSVDDLGQTVIMVTHDPDAAGYADRVVELADGRIAGDHRQDRDAA